MGSRVELAAVLAGGFALTAVLASGIASASFWYDEVATISGAGRSLASLGGLTGNVDAVHGLYYVLMHGVVRLFGSSEFAMRLPSVIATVLAAVGIYAIGRVSGSRSVGAIAALLFAVLPRSTWMSTEARSFAVATLAAVIMTLLVVIAMKSASWWAVAAYAVVAVFAVHLFMYLAMVAAAHVIFVLAARPPRALLFRLLAGIGLAGLACLPHIFRVLSQRGQLGGIYSIDVDTPVHVVVDEYFMEATILSVVFWTLFTASTVVVLWRRRSLAGPPLMLGLSWLIFPHVVVLGYSAVFSSIYQPRSFAMTTPALCLIAAQLFLAAFRLRGTLAALVCMTLLAVPSYLQQRSPTAKGTDWREAAVAIHEISLPDDAIVYMPPDSVHSYSALIELAYAQFTTGTSDPALVTSALDRPYLFDERLALGMYDDRLSGPRVLLVQGTANPDADVQAAISHLGELGFVETGARELTTTSIRILERGQPAG